MSSDSTDRTYELEVYNIKDIEEINLLKLFIKKASAEFKKPEKTKAERDKIALENMERRRRLYTLMNEIMFRNRLITNLRNKLL